MRTEPIHPAVRVGHIHLRVTDLDRAIAFYRDALGFSVTAESKEGNTALLAAGDYHHHIGLTASPSAGGSPPPHGDARLGHVAFLYPGRRELGRAIRRLLDHGHEIHHGTDHGAATSMYLADPDGNEIELYYDHPREAWFDANGRPILKDERIDPRTVLRCAHGQPRIARPPASHARSAAQPQDPVGSITESAREVM